MKTITYIMMLLCSAGILIGCAGFNQGVDQVGGTVGTVAGVPQQVNQSVTKGYVNQTMPQTSNPYGR